MQKSKKRRGSSMFSLVDVGGKQGSEVKDHSRNHMKVNQYVANSGCLVD